MGDFKYKNELAFSLIGKTNGLLVIKKSSFIVLKYFRGLMVLQITLRRCLHQSS